MRSLSPFQHIKTKIFFSRLDWGGLLIAKVMAIRLWLFPLSTVQYLASSALISRLFCLYMDYGGFKDPSKASDLYWQLSLKSGVQWTFLRRKLRNLIFRAFRGLKASPEAWTSLLGVRINIWRFRSIYKHKIFPIFYQRKSWPGSVCLDWIRTQHGLGSGYELIKMPGSGFGLTESAAETLYSMYVTTMVKLIPKNRLTPLGEKRLKQC
jgi:hypothetical protein